MDFCPTPLLPLPDGACEAIFLSRHKRFSVLCLLHGEEVWAHTNNTGAMLGLLRPGAHVLLSPAVRPGRKLPWTLERIRIGHGKSGFWAGVNTQLPNKLLAAAFQAGQLDFARDYNLLKLEAKWGPSRLDGCFSAPALPRLWVECKSVTLVEDEVAAFPDARSERGRKHLQTLAQIAARGERAAMFYLLQRPDGKCFAPADYIDQEYAGMFWNVCRQGVEIYVYRANFTPLGTDLGGLMPIVRENRS